MQRKQGWLHGKTVTYGWAEAVMQKLLAIQKYFGQTDGLTNRPALQGVECKNREIHLRS